MNYLILADIHANLPALEAVLDRESGWDEVLFLGDAVDAGPHPDEVLARLSELPGEFVMGNHDRAVLDAPSTPPPPGSTDFRRWTAAQLSAESRRFLASFEGSVRVETPERPLRLHHGDFEFDAGCEPDDGRDWNGRLWPDTDESVFAALASRYDEPVVVSAHSHVQFETRVDGTRFLNPGSVGQHRLGTVAACYATLEDGEFDLRAVEYDADRTVEALGSLPLAESYLDGRRRIYTEGVLPDEMRDFGPLREEGYR